MDGNVTILTDPEDVLNRSERDFRSLLTPPTLSEEEEELFPNHVRLMNESAKLLMTYNSDEGLNREFEKWGVGK